MGDPEFLAGPWRARNTRCWRGRPITRSIPGLVAKRARARLLTRRLSRGDDGVLHELLGAMGPDVEIVGPILL
jgi:hypothetical protein